MELRAGAGLIAATLLVLMAAGCNGVERERRAQVAAERQRQQIALVSRCRLHQAVVNQQLQALNSSSAALSQLSRRSYLPLPQPAAPDPAILARFTRDDQELEQERYQQALAQWREADGAERRRWEAQQEGERQRLTARRAQARAALDKLGVAATPEAQIAWSRCDGPQLTALTQGAASALR